MADEHPLPLTGYLREFNHKRCDWTIYSARLEQYFVANAIDDAARKRAMLLNACDEESYALIYNLCLPGKPENNTYAQIIELFRSHFAPMKSCFPERYKFYNASKIASETVQDWAARVRNLAAHCEFGTELKVMLRDRFIMGFGKGPVMDRLFEENVKDLTFEKAITIAANKDASRHNYELTPEVKQEPADVYRVRDVTESTCPCQAAHGNSRQDFADHRAGPPRFSKTSVVSSRKCHVCGKPNHSASVCRYRDFVCNICKVKGHLAQVCRNKNNRGGNHYLESAGEDNNVDMVFHVKINTNANTPITAQVFVNNVPFDFEIDSGSSVTVISHELYNNLLKNYVKLQHTDKYLINYTGGTINPVGVMNVIVEFNNVKHNLDIYVVKNGGPPLLGRDFIRKFEVSFLYVKKIDIRNEISSLLNEFKNSVFSSEMGTFTKGILSLKVKGTVNPKFCKPRPLPFAIKNKVDEELDRLIKENIIVPVSYSQWGTPIVPVIKKNNTVRICGDYKITVNPVLEIDQYPLPRIEELFVKLQGGEKFSKLDLSQAYQQVLLDDESRKLTTISTHRGLFEYTRLPYGVSSAPALFQKLMDAVLQGIPGVVIFLDDILCTGKNDNDHLQNLRNVLNKLRECGLKVCKEKCEFMKNSVTYLGFIIDKEGLHTCPDKILAIQNAPNPTNVTQLKSILGLINYYNKFVGNSAKILKPLYNLLKDNVTWTWTSDCENAFKIIKSTLASSKVLVHYNPELPVKLTVDASAYGIGSVISHVFPTGFEKPIAYASRTLTKSETNYSHIEKEALAIIFGVSKFYQYLYGRKFVLVTDHKPLVTIFGPKTGIPVIAASRLQRWAIILANFDYSIEYVKSDRNKADAFSRLPLKNCHPSSDENTGYLNYIEKNTDIPISSQIIAIETEKDEVLSKISDYIMNGWPSKVDSMFKPYFLKRFLLTIQNGCILFGYKVVIPAKLQLHILKQLHESHLGIVKMKSLARSYVWWPNINIDIENEAKNCQNCMECKEMPPKVPLNTWPYPEGPWERLHIDFLGPFYNRYIFVIIDAYSKWVEAFIMNNITSRASIHILRSTFARFGLPKHIVSDNGTQLTSDEFKHYLKCNGIKHTTTATYYPATNGAAENVVKTIKIALTAAMDKESNNDLHLLLNRFLLNYRNSEHCTTRKSPAQLMFGRQLRSRLDLLKPTDTDIYKNKSPKHDVVRQNVFQTQNKQKKYYGGKRIVDFNVNDIVFVKNYKVNKPKWILASIVKKCSFTNYLVKTKVSNLIWKRHVNQIRKTTGLVKPYQHKSIFVNNQNGLICDTTSNKDNIVSEVDINNQNKQKDNIVSEVDINNQNKQLPTNSENNANTPRKSKRRVKLPDRYGYDLSYIFSEWGG